MKTYIHTFEHVQTLIRSTSSSCGGTQMRSLLKRREVRFTSSMELKRQMRKTRRSAPTSSMMVVEM